MFKEEMITIYSDQKDKQLSEAYTCKTSQLKCANQTDKIKFNLHGRTKLKLIL